VLVAILGSAIVFYLKAADFINGPLPRGLELYSHNWGFQLIMYAFFWLPGTLALLGVVLLMEYGVAMLRSKVWPRKR
jgi:hypothetical protein